MLKIFSKKSHKTITKKNFLYVFLFLNFFVLCNTLFLDSLKSNEIQPDKLIPISEKKSSENYILGPGDKLYIFHKDIPEYSGNFSIGPDGFVLLPEVFQVYAEGLTIHELKEILTNKYREFVKNPNIFMNVSQLRPVRVYLSGEIARPGYYTISNSYNQGIPEITKDFVNTSEMANIFPSGKYSDYILPTVFDSIKAAKGLTIYSDLSNIEVIRKNTISNGGGYIKTNLNFLELINGDTSQNIRVFDGDKITVKKTDENHKDQFLKVLNTNISPSEIAVFVSGQVESPGRISVPTGSGLNQAIALAGGKKFMSGDIEFLRFYGNSKVEKRKFKADMNADLSTYKNPILLQGDVINIKGSIIGNATQFINTTAAPIITTYSLYNLFND